MLGLRADYTKSVEAVFTTLTAAPIREADEKVPDLIESFDSFHLRWCTPRK
jgi:hypothetical protein